MATPLAIAAYFGHAEVVGLLLERRADPMNQDSDGFTVLHWAARNGHVAVVQRLLQRPEGTGVEEEMPGDAIWTAGYQTGPRF
jgi:ankyrin repeat protein